MDCVDSPKFSYLCPKSQYLSMYSETGPLREAMILRRGYYWMFRSNPAGLLTIKTHTHRHTWSVWHVNRQQGGEPSVSQGARSHRELIQPVIHLRLPASRTVRKVWTSYPACGICYSGPNKLTQWSLGLSVHPHLHTT